MKKLLIITIVASVALGIVSCNKPDPTPVVPVIPETTVGTYVLNSGNYGSNDANLCGFDPFTYAYHWSEFQRINGVKLGDTGQDMMVFGSKMYISVCNSGVIMVVDKRTCKLLGKIVTKLEECGDKPLSPRSFTHFEKWAYVSYYEGYVAQIDTATFDVLKIQKVGDNPDDIVIGGNKLFVANSGGMNYPDYGNTVNVLNPVDLNVFSTIKVAVNPNKMAVDSTGNVYLISWGNYADIPACLQKIDNEKETVTVIEDVKNPYDLSMGYGDNLFIITSEYDENWNQKTEVVVYSTKLGLYVGGLIQDGTQMLGNAYSVTADPVNGLVYVGCSDYVNSGTMYIFNLQGHNVTSFDTGGLNPITVAFVTNK